VRTIATCGLALLCLPTARCLGAAEADDARLHARIRKLVRQLGHKNYRTREDASKELRRIGRPAFEAVRDATRDADAERAWRARKLLEHIRRLPDPSAVDPNCTNGHVPVHKNCSQLQTFTVPADTAVDTLRFRAARTLHVPLGKLSVDLRSGTQPDAKTLASASFNYEWTDEDGDTHGVTRFMQWFEAPMKARLRKGRTYCLVFRAAAPAADRPWLLNCFYRDTFRGGRHLQRADNEAKSLGQYDLVFELQNGENAVVTSVPDGTDLTKKEHFGLTRNGIDLRKTSPAAR
jgi:hypothetical protein